jgi:hypothetical protein
MNNCVEEKKETLKEFASCAVVKSMFGLGFYLADAVELRRTQDVIKAQLAFHENSKPSSEDNDPYHLSGKSKK